MMARDLVALSAGHGSTAPWGVAPQSMSPGAPGRHRAAPISRLNLRERGLRNSAVIGAIGD
jgi:hypothetical protein